MTLLGGSLFFKIFGDVFLPYSLAGVFACLFLEWESCVGVGSLWRHPAKEHQANVGWLWQTHLLLQRFISFFFEVRLNGDI